MTGPVCQFDASHEFVPGAPLPIRRGTPVEFRVGGWHCAAAGDVDLYFSPSPEVRIRIDGAADGACTERMTELLASTAACRAGGVQTPTPDSVLGLPELGLELDASQYLVTYDLDASPRRLVFSLPGRLPPLGDSEAPVAQMTFLLPNLDAVAFAGPDPARMAMDAPGDLELAGSPWRLRLSVSESCGKAIPHLPEVGYAVTQVGAIDRTDGATFTAEEGARALDQVVHLLSFVNGSVVNACVPRAHRAAGDVVWEDLSAPAIGPWRRTEGVFCSNAIDCLRQCWRPYLRLMGNDNWRDALLHAINFYALACESPDDGTAIVQAQVALESLCRLVLVTMDKALTRQAYRKLFAASQISYLVGHIGADEGLPERLAPEAGKRWDSGPQALVNLRNGVVHGTNATDLAERGYIGAARDLAIH